MPPAAPLESRQQASAALLLLEDAYNTCRHEIEQIQHVSDTESSESDVDKHPIITKLLESGGPEYIITLQISLTVNFYVFMTGNGCQLIIGQIKIRTVDVKFRSMRSLMARCHAFRDHHALGLFKTITERIG